MLEALSTCLISQVGSLIEVQTPVRGFHRRSFDSSKFMLGGVASALLGSKEAWPVVNTNAERPPKSDAPSTINACKARKEGMLNCHKLLQGSID
jgi:hypothetical protein